MTETTQWVDYALRYGGMCRGCADAEVDGVCDSNGTPCNPTVFRAAIEHALKVWQYGILHGFITNPISASPPPPSVPVGVTTETLDQYYIIPKEMTNNEWGEVKYTVDRKADPDIPLWRIQEAIKAAAFETIHRTRAALSSALPQTEAVAWQLRCLLPTGNHQWRNPVLPSELALIRGTGKDAAGIPYAIRPLYATPSVSSLEDENRMLKKIRQLYADTYDFRGFDGVDYTCFALAVRAALNQPSASIAEGNDNVRT